MVEISFSGDIVERVSEVFEHWDYDEPVSFSDIKLILEGSPALTPASAVNIIDYDVHKNMMLVLSSENKNRVVYFFKFISSTRYKVQVIRFSHADRRLFLTQFWMSTASTRSPCAKRKGTCSYSAGGPS